MLAFTPYPKSQSIKEILFSSLAAGILVYLFLIIFQPFGTESFHHPYKYLILFPYTVIFGSSFFASDLCTSRFKNWNIISELLKILLILFLGSTLSYFYNSLFISHVALSFGNYCYMFLYSLSIGIPISAIYILSRYIYLNSHKNITPNNTPQQIETPEHSINTILRISANNTILTIAEKDLLCVQSMENYCTLYYLESNTVKKIWLRIGLSNILTQIQTQTIKRCHRSYIINLGKVKNIKGNAQGYKLFLPEIDFEIPVSRSFISIIIPELQHIKT
ncbi:transcriptional regulator, LytTR family [Chryseobacterium ureilyticum]|uniref:Transcriptional regulator, LytTR family n=1 Tax=Chryseobacterium ureilyticum TaxID=373668 RepID=A0A1N7NGM5_9FLAO|nr:LytTR family DNA-binding domain-containing protein [Chryseobacterium ureilyticum]SIS97553.1 transcriptional regulator, LytTR family [Chryseobacterium ureilyticum]